MTRIEKIVRLNYDEELVHEWETRSGFCLEHKLPLIQADAEAFRQVFGRNPPSWATEPELKK